MSSENMTYEEAQKKIKNDKIKRNEEEHIVNSYVEGIHFTLCFIFFLLTIIFILELTYSLINMEPSNNDDIETARSLMTSAVVIGFTMILIIICIVIGLSYYAKNKPDSYDNLSKSLNKSTGGHNVYISIRIVIFSILMFSSIILSSLCLSAAKEIDNSGYKSEYEDQYNTCMDLGKTFLTHFMIFTFAQLLATCYKMLFTSGNISAKTITALEPTSSNII